jgi:glycosyltransferase WbpL
VSAGLVILGASGAAALVSVVVVRTIERRARQLGLIDMPNARSSHVEPRPRGGGIGIIAGTSVGIVLLSLTGVEWSGTTWWWLGASGLMAGIGLWDDLRHPGVLPRLLLQTSVAGAFVWACGGFDQLPLPSPADVSLGLIGMPLAVAWLVGVTNFFNFMDGADGLAAGQAVLSLSVAACAVWPEPTAALAVVGVAATLGFLTRNWAPARIFLGDVGSSWLGFQLAALPLVVAVKGRGPLVLLVGTSLALFLLDPAATLVRRAWRGAAIGQAHREHTYQRLFNPGDTHARAVAALLGTAAALSAIALAGLRWPSLGWLGIALAFAAFAVEVRVAGVGRRDRV